MSIANNILAIQNISISGSTNLRIGRGFIYDFGGMKYDFDYNELLINTNINWQNFSIWLQYEMSDPPEYGKSINTINRANLTYQHNNLALQLGDIYTSWDRGLLLSQFDDQQIDFDNSIRGLSINFSLERIDFEVLAGSKKQYLYSPIIIDQRNPDEIDEHFIFGGRAGLNFNSFSTALALLSGEQTVEYFSRSSQTNIREKSSHTIVGLSADYYNKFGDLHGELAIKKAKINPPKPFYEIDYTDFSTDTLFRKDENGLALFLNGNYYLNGLVFAIELKHYALSVKDPDKQNWYPYLEGALIYQNPPLGYLEHSSTLLNRNTHPLNKNNEMGFQMSINTEVSNLGHLLLNYSKGSQTKSWKRDAPELAFFITPWQKDKQGFIYPLKSPSSLPFEELYAEFSFYGFNNRFTGRIGYADSKQVLLLQENIRSNSLDSTAYEYANAMTIPFDLQFSFPKKYTIETKIEVQWLEKGFRAKSNRSGIKTDKKSSVFFEQKNDKSIKIKKRQIIYSYSFGLGKSPYWGINFHVEREKYDEFGIDAQNIDINPLESAWKQLGFATERTWLSLELLLNIGPKYRFTVWYGSEKGGLQCSNGVCRFVQPFSDGLKLNLVTFF